MRASVIALVAACSAQEGPAVVAPHPPEAAAMLAEVASTYEHARSYADRGTVTTAFTRRGTTQAERKTFQTAFVRDDRFRFEFRKDDDPRRAYVIWSDGEHTYTRWYAKPGVEDVGASFALAIASATGISGGSAHTIPDLLMPRIVGGTSITALHATAPPTAELVDGHPCWHVTGTIYDPTELWIDQQTHLVRRIVTRHHFGPETKGGEFDAQETTDYDGAIDVQITAAQLQPPDLSGGVTTPSALVWIGMRPDRTSTRVLQVVRGAPADRGGLKLGDEIVSIAGTPVTSGAEIIAAIRAQAAGKGVAIVVRRAGAEQTLTVVPEDRPGPDALQATLLDKPAPELTLATVGGGPPVKLADLRGQVVIVEFWATWCGPCAITSPKLDDWQRKLGGKGLRVVGISDEPVADIQKFLAAHKLGYTIALDPDDAATTTYLVQGLPTIIVVDKAGTVRFSEIGVPDFDALEALVTKLL